MLALLCREDDPGLLWWQTCCTSCLQDSFECMKYFGPVSGLGVTLAVLNKVRAEEASHAVSVARADGVSKRTGCLGRPLAVVPSAGTGTCIWEVRAACAAATHLWQYLRYSSCIFCTCSSLHAADFCFHSDGINTRGWAKVHIDGKRTVWGQSARFRSGKGCPCFGKVTGRHCDEGIEGFKMSGGVRGDGDGGGTHRCVGLVDMTM